MLKLTVSVRLITPLNLISYPVDAIKQNEEQHVKDERYQVNNMSWWHI